MKYGIAVTALIAGLMLGSWWPRSDLRIARNKISKLEAELAQKDKRYHSMLSDVTRMLNVTASPRRVENRERHPVPMITVVPAEPVRQVPDARFEPDMENFESLDEYFESARELWNIRVSMARESLLESLDLTDPEVAEFDSLTAEMNRRLREQIQASVDAISEREELYPEDGLELVHEITGIMLDVYGNLDRVFPPDWRTRASGDVELFSFIDPMVAEPFLDLEDFPEGF